MTTSLWLRFAALITLLYCAGHTMGMPWTPATGSQETAVIDAMKSARFDALGSERTYWQFYFGFGLIISGTGARCATCVRELLTQVDAGLAEVSPAARGAVH